MRQGFDRRRKQGARALKMTLKAHQIVFEEEIFQIYKKKWPYKVSERIREAMRKYLESIEETYTLRARTRRV